MKLRENMKTSNKILNKRYVTSLILLITLIMMPASGIIVHAMHGDKISHTWLHLHTLLGVLFLITGIFHVVYNWRALKNYLVSKK
jgi:uncharacterized membrane protein